MSTLTDEPRPDVELPDDPEADENFGEVPLTLLFGTEYALGMKHLLVTTLFGLSFVFLTYIPLFHTDLWDHVAYGHHILETGELPTEDPFLALAKGVPILCTMWLSQVLFAGIEQGLGPEQLSTLYAATVFGSYLVLASVFYWQTRRLGMTVLGVLIVFAVVGWNRHLVIRPEMFGWLLFAALIAIVVRAQAWSEAGDEDGPRWKAELRLWPLWLGVPAMFALWANLHGSYVCGLALLGCYLLGRAAEIGWRTRDPMAVLRDRWVQRWVVLVELAVAGTLLNPYGIDLLIHNLAFAGHENLTTVTEWDPLVIASPAGIGFALVWVAIVFVLRQSRRPFRAAEILSLALFTVLSLIHVRMQAWFAPVAAMVLVPHLGDIYDRLRPAVKLTYVSPIHEGEVPLMQRSSWSYTVCCLGMLWICFALSAFYRPMVTGEPRRPEHLYSRQTPRALAAHLRANPPEGQVWNTQMWGGWLVWAGHAEGDPPPQVFITTNIHVAPPTVWKDYLHVFQGGSSWQTIFDRYRVNTVIVDKSMQPELRTALERSPLWTIDYEDNLSLVAKRADNRTVTPAGEPADDEPAADGAAADETAESQKL